MLKLVSCLFIIFFSIESNPDGWDLPNDWPFYGEKN